MDIFDALYVMNFVFTTIVIAMDLLIIRIATKTGEVRNNLLLHIIILSMGLDFLGYLNNAVHDFPSYMLDKDIFQGSQAWYASVLILCCQWFDQLFVLLVLSLIHFIAIFYPTHFRAISRKMIFMINLMITVIAILLTIPLLTPFCGYAYYTQGHYWSFDMTKPYTYLYWTFNIVLQITCVAVVALVDFIIIWKIYGLRRTTVVRKKNGLSTTSAPKPRISREMRLALSFLFLSVCFLSQTVLFNLPLGNGILVTILRRMTSNLNLAKWAIYSLGSAAIRHGILRFFKCHKTDSALSVTIQVVYATGRVFLDRWVELAGSLGWLYLQRSAMVPG